MTFEVFLLISLVLFTSAYIKGVTGFGTSLIAIPVLIAFFLVPAEARALIVSINLLLNIYILVSAKRLRFEDYKPYLLLIISVFVAALISGFLLPRVTFEIFNVLMGILLIFTAINRFFDIKFNIKHPKRYYIPLGLIGGTLNTLLGAGSVPVLIFLGNIGVKKTEFRVTVSLFLLILNAGSLISFVISSTYTSQTALWALIFTPVMVLGTFFGIRSQHVFNEKVFSRVVAVLLFIIGVNSIFTLF
ncbi:sulfite exporter TauE/SafE family protein [Liberiplasma polymorphum]|uniref:sulfite exporter TauE/SafE family protein n=1 Tax=Liberiplasma polymorphum TaxID=3374570 RepID=UPI003773C847